VTVHFRLIGDVHGHLASYGKVAAQAKCSLQVGDMGYDYGAFPNLDHTKHVFFGGNHDDYTMGNTDLSPDDPLVLVGDNNYTVVAYGKRNFAEQCVGYLGELQDDPTVYEFINMPLHHLGNYGIWKIPGVVPVEGGLSGSIFWVRGAWSIDGKYRLSQGPHAGWFAREQLSIAEGETALELYARTKPDFVVTHDCPSDVQKYLRLLFSDGKKIPTQTGKLLQAMFDTHKPKLWVFGHYHQYVSFNHEETNFVCLNMFPEEGWCLDFDENLKPIGIV
jgi:hypothetical protein